MDKKSTSVINDVVGTFAAVSVVAYLLSLTFDQSTPQPLAQSSATHQAVAVSTVAHFSNDLYNNHSNVDINQFKHCKLVGVNQSKAILTLDCSKGQIHSTQQI